MQVGIIGLPNVGKSTIFNVLAKANAEVANYPFCTIEPNTGIIEVPDPYLDKLSRIYNSKKVTPATIKMLDVAGLVKDANKGEGLGNKFLSHIRNADILAHVVRCFKSENISVSGSLNPVEDIEIINTELMLSDIEIIRRREEKLKSLLKSGDKEAKAKLEFATYLSDNLNAGNLPDIKNINKVEEDFLRELNLLSTKPVLYVANVDESRISTKLYNDLVSEVGKENVVKIYAELENELLDLPEEERPEYEKELGIEEEGLDVFIRSCYKLLDLITFYTLNENEARAWSLEKGKNVVEAAGQIHSDMARGFIKAEVIATAFLPRNP
ncbi:MAG: redox-regulated ATPase YchF [Candidatus Humimicrobiaceae bacterium]